MTPDKEQVVEPLTTEEIEDIRVRGTNLGLVDPRFYSLWGVINRLLATLDAARTASVAGLDREAVIEKVASEHGIFVGGYSWWCCGPHPGTNEPDEDHSHAEFDFGKKGSRKATRHFIDAVLAALNSAPSIEQEPGERGLIARYQEVIAADETIASLCGHRPTVEDGPWNEALRRRERALAAIGVAARTASVAGLDRYYRAEPLGDDDDGWVVCRGADRVLVVADEAEASRVVSGLNADLFHAVPPIEQEPGETLRAAACTAKHTHCWEHARAALEADPQETER